MKIPLWLQTVILIIIWDCIRMFLQALVTKKMLRKNFENIEEAVEEVEEAMEEEE